MNPGELLIFALAGGFAGFLAGLVGIGGGVIYVPVLLYALEAGGLAPAWVPRVAVATSLAVIQVTLLVSGYTHWKLGNLRVRALPGLVLAGVIGSFLASLVLGLVAAAPFKVILGLFQIYLGSQLLATKGQGGQGQAGSARFIAIGGVAGWISGFFGVGGGLIIMPLLHLGANFSLPHAVGTATGFMIFSVAAGLSSYLIQGWDLALNQPGVWGLIHLPAFLALLPMAMVFSRVGAKVSVKVNAARLRRWFGLLVVALGLASAWQGLASLWA